MSSRADSYEYNPKTGKWEPKSDSSGSSSSGSSSSSSSKSSSKGNSPSSTTASNTVATVNSSSKVNSKAQADKKYIEVEYNTLEGDITLVPTAKTIRIKTGDTIRLKGVGKYLSGLYYVSAVKRTIDKDSGYSITLTVIKTGFGSSLKDAEGADSVNNSTPIFKSGDRVMFSSVEGEYKYTNGSRVPNWVKKKILTVDSVSSDGNKVKIKEPSQWTYAKYLKKV